jgi:ferritin
MIKQKMAKALSDQINKEMYSGYLYLAMSTYFQTLNLPGAAAWMRVQAQEELGHAMKIYDHVIERDGTVTLEAIEAPPDSWDSPLAAFQAAFEHEQKVTGMIDNLVRLAREKEDYAAETFLQWFVTEQVEEEASVSEVLHKLEMVGSAPGGLFMVDRALGQRGESTEPD